MNPDVIDEAGRIRALRRERAVSGRIGRVTELAALLVQLLSRLDGGRRGGHRVFQFLRFGIAACALGENESASEGESSRNE